MTIELQTVTIDGAEYMFDYFPVNIGAAIPFNTNHLSIFPTILSFGD
jgi:hypothetical protein